MMSRSVRRGIQCWAVVLLSSPVARAAELSASAPVMTDNTVQIAQATAPDETVPDETAPDTLRIVVTAEKTPAAAQDVPISLTVLTEQEIEAANITSLEDVAARVPNFSVFSAGGNRSFLTYSIRGLSNASVLNRDSVAFYVDDIPYENGNFLNTNLPDLERVEILRGPQSTLYGRSSIGGVVNIITRKPTNTFEFNGAASYGNFDDVDLQAAVGGPLVDDQLFYRLSGSYGRRDGYVDNLFLDEDVDPQSGGNGRAQLLWTPSDEWEVLLTGSFDDYRDGASTFLPLDADPFEANLNEPGFSDLEANTQALKVSYTHPNFQATSITARRYARNREAFDADFSPLDFVAVQANASSTIFSQELRLQSPQTDGPFQWLVGGYLESRTFNIDSGLLLGADGFTPGLNLTRSESESQTAALFGQVSYQPVEALTLTAGLRYEANESTLETLERTFTPTGSPISFPSGNSFDEIDNNGDALLPRLAAEYRFSPNVMAYGSIARGYRPAGVNFQATVAEAVPFGAERSWNYEAGLKSSWLDDRLGVNLAVFHNDVDDFQVTFFNPGINASLVTGAGAQITGAELEVRAVPVEGLTVTAGLGLIDGELTNLTNPFTGESSDASELLAAPDVTYNVAVQYRAPFGLLGRVELLGSGTTFFDEANTIKQAPFALVNARLGYEFERYGVYLFANNLFDTEYITGGFTTATGDVATYGVPATYGVQLKAQF